MKKELKNWDINSGITIDVINFSENVTFQRIAPYCIVDQIDVRNGERVRVRQVFGKTQAQRIVEAFEKNKASVLAKQPSGDYSIPFYYGHPDHTSGMHASVVDTRVYARAEALEARDDGLYATIKREPELDQLKAEKGRLEISPRFFCDVSNDKIFPKFINSIGLVENGNLENADVINSTVNKMNEEQLKRLAEILGVEDAAVLQDPEVIITKVGELKTAQSNPEEQKCPAAPENNPDNNDEENKKLAEAAAKAAVDAANTKAEFFANKLIDEKIAEGRVLVAEREFYKSNLMANPQSTLDVVNALPIRTNKPSKADEAASGNKAKVVTVDSVNAKIDELTRERCKSLKGKGKTVRYSAVRDMVVASEEGQKILKELKN